MDVQSISTLAVCLLLLVVQVITIVNIRRLKTQLNNLKKRYTNHSQEDHSGWQVRQIINEVKALQSQVNGMKEAVNSLGQKTVRQTECKTLQPIEKGREEIAGPDGSNDIFYFASADSRGVFDEAQSTKVESRDSLYAIEILNEDEAKIRIFQNLKAWESALQSPELYVVPVCTFRGSPTSSNRISMVNEGLARMENGRWRVVQKIEIKLS